MIILKNLFQQNISNHVLDADWGFAGAQPQQVMPG